MIVGRSGRTDVGECIAYVFVASFDMSRSLFFASRRCAIKGFQPLSWFVHAAESPRLREEARASLWQLM